MAEPRHVQCCQWAEPTLFLANPFWTAAEDYPWSCHADGVPHPVEDTAACGACSRWALRDPRVAERDGTFDWR
jgi:hypothetical protein